MREGMRRVLANRLACGRRGGGYWRDFKCGDRGLCAGWEDGKHVCSGQDPDDPAVTPAIRLDCVYAGGTERNPSPAPGGAAYWRFAQCALRRRSDHLGWWGDGHDDAPWFLESVGLCRLGWVQGSATDRWRRAAHWRFAYYGVAPITLGGGEAVTMTYFGSD